MWRVTSKVLPSWHLRSHSHRRTPISRHRPVSSAHLPLPACLPLLCDLPIPRIGSLGSPVPSACVTLLGTYDDLPPHMRPPAKGKKAAPKGIVIIVILVSLGIVA